MKLEGWINDLPDYVVAAIKEGHITIHQAKGYQYLVGKVWNPAGHVVEFQ